MTAATTITGICLVGLPVERVRELRAIWALLGPVTVEQRLAYIRARMLGLDVGEAIEVARREAVADGSFLRREHFS
jgi:hypothetical protein